LILKDQGFSPDVFILLQKARILYLRQLIYVRGRTENGANCSMFGSAIMALCSGRTNRLQLSFSAPFLWFFLWTNKERTGKD
jgi:hypothetical protein